MIFTALCGATTPTVDSCRETFSNRSTKSKFQRTFLLSTVTPSVVQSSRTNCSSLTTSKEPANAQQHELLCSVLRQRAFDRTPMETLVSRALALLFTTHFQIRIQDCERHSPATSFRRAASTSLLKS